VDSRVNPIASSSILHRLKRYVVPSVPFYGFTGSCETFRLRTAQVDLEESSTLRFSGENSVALPRKTRIRAQEY
jgi:hypothetical protein